MCILYVYDMFQWPVWLCFQLRIEDKDSVLFTEKEHIHRVIWTEVEGQVELQAWQIVKVEIRTLRDVDFESR